MHSNHLDYINLLQEFVNANFCDLFYEEEKNYLCFNFYIARKNHHTTPDIKWLINDKKLTLELIPVMRTITFIEDDLEELLYDFFNEKPEMWILFFKYHPLQHRSFFNFISFIPDNIFYSCLDNFKLISKLYINEKSLHIFFSRLRECSLPLNSNSVCRFLIPLRESFKHPHFVVALVQEIKNFPYDFQRKVYKTLKISQQAHEINNPFDFAKELNMISFSFNKLKFLGYLNTQLTTSSHQLTCEVITQAFTNFITFFPHAIFGGDSLDSKFYEVHIDFVKFLQTDRLEQYDKDFFKEFIIKNITDLIQYDLSSSYTDEIHLSFLKNVEKFKNFLHLNRKLSNKTVLDNLKPLKI